MTLDELVRRHLAQLLKLERTSVKNLLDVYREQVKILTGELALLPEDRFSYQHLSKVITQLKAGVDLMEAKVQDQLIIDQVKVHELSLKHGADELALGEKLAQEAGAPAPIVDRIQKMFAPLVNSPALKAFREATKLSTKLWAANELNTIKSVVMSGLIRSSHPRKVADDLRKRLSDDRTEYQIQRIAQTEFWNGANTAHRVANEAITEKYPELGYEHDWEDMLDNRVCPTCSALGALPPVPVGKPFVLNGAEYFQPTAHPFCRCRLKVTCERWRRREEAAKKKAAEASAVQVGDQSTEPTGVPVSKALDVQLGPKAKAGVAARRAVDLIDQVHGDGKLPQIPVKPSSSTTTLGSFRYHRGGSPVDINLSTRGDHPELTLAHEVGHFLDHQGFTPGYHASTAAPEMDGFRKAFEQTDAVQKLKEAKRKGFFEFTDEAGQTHKGTIDRRHLEYINYLLEPHEGWARAYSQFIAEKSQDPVMLKQVDDIRRAPSISRWSQWASDDFKPILGALEALMEKQGWLKRKSP